MKASLLVLTCLLSSSSKLSLSAKDSNNTSQEHYRPESARPCQVPKRLVSEVSPSAKSSSVNGVTPLATSNLVSPSPGASSAFGLGSGAFASFGSTARIPRTPSTSLHIGDAAPHIERRGQEVTTELSSEDVVRRSDVPYLHSRASAICPEHTLKATWVIWYRPPTHKFSDYEKSTMPLAIFGSVEAFWKVYTHLKRPSALPSVSDYHIFKKGVRPVWEDQENKRGGKWILRLRKGVADRYWEDLLLAIVGDQFAEAGEEICGAVLSVRTGEDVLSIWTRIDGGKNIKIRYVSYD